MAAAGDIDFAAEGLLDGVPEDRRAERLELLDWLAGQGFDAQDLRWASDRGSLGFLAAGAEIGGRRQYTLEELARRAHVDADFLVRLRRAQGLPNPPAADRAFSELDVRVAANIATWIEHGFDEELIVRTTRVVGIHLDHAAEAMRAALFELIAAPGAGEREVAEAYATSTRNLIAFTDEMVVGMTRQHLGNVMQSELAGAFEVATGRPVGQTEMAVAFVDLVGFTRLGEQLPPEELGRVADRLFVLVQEHVREPVRLVKTIGDAVLLSSTEIGPLVELAVTLCGETLAGAEDMPQLRIGIAYGPVVARVGDVFGAVVNLADRVTGVARAGSVLATLAVRDGAREEFHWSAAGVRRLKGIPTPVPLFRARPLGAAGDG